MILVTNSAASVEAALNLLKGQKMPLFEERDEEDEKDPLADHSRSHLGFGFDDDEDDDDDDDDDDD